jgi:hypothetical protein
MVGAALEEVGRDVTDAAAIGGFDHSDAYLTRSKFVLDQEAWEELGEMLQAVLDRGDELQKESAKRLRASAHEGERRAGLVMMLFESTPTVPGADAAKRPAGSSRKAPARGRARASRVTA